MFVGMGVSAVFPVLDGLRMFGVRNMENQIGLFWLVLQGGLYILGAGLYAVSHSPRKYTSICLRQVGRPESRKYGILARLTS